MKKSIVVSSVLMLFLHLLLDARQKNKKEKKLLMYCAAGVKPAVEKIAKDYYKDYGVRIDLQYGGSGTLLSNLRVAKQGDLYLAGDQSYLEEAASFGIIEETQPLAYLKPVIAVAKGNPKNLRSVTDLFLNTTRVAIANPNAASIGRLTKKMLLKTQQWDSLQNNIEVLMPTVNEVANTIKLGTIDAGIIWDATANQYPEIETIEIPSFSAFTKSISVGVLSYSKQPSEALKFLRYLSAIDKGLPTFKKMGYKPIIGDVWEEIPELLFFSGGVNRLAIEHTIQQFEIREGIQVTRVYNGCGILVAQIKAGQQPDAYLSCDVSFMTQVNDKFKNITDISKTNIVIVTQKGNPKKIHNLNDLTREGLVLGVCNYKQSALGALTKKMLENNGIWEPILKNVRSQTPTADLLVNQIRTGSLDAVIVYEANVSQVKDKLKTIYLEDKDASALQNFGIYTQTNQPYLTQRLLHYITSKSSQKSYINHGFTWEFKQNK